ncbi:GNAT family N-acetyltransferase [Filobacillus milosensis]|uniref:GNAT family N-acetyltransferase n=1 Tax=Filobacillus milosensis TaxID=94137 RepID=A0A4Y8IG47_9BACI|nr:GNAT family N-acetyltransferase [Filobacillus milosensis]TFB19491.1 GNAT family N-acetyltransferase [Filobacillus milosensis]
MNTRYATIQDQNFIDELCQLSYSNKKQWIGYPRVSDLNELLAELKEYENTLDNSILIIEKDSEMIGFTGFLFEPGDDEAFVIGPVFVEQEHTFENVSRLLETLMERSNFKDLFITVPSENHITNRSLKNDDWKNTYKQYEMKYELAYFNSVDLKYDIHPLTNSKGVKFNSVAQLFENVFEWKNAEERLGHYLDDFGMDAAYIEKDGELQGAVLWDDIEDTDFVRLEDVAVHPKARRQGIASELIVHVLNKFADTNKATVFLAVDLDNNNANNLYEKLGFETTMLNCSYKCMKG